MATATQHSNVRTAEVAGNDGRPLAMLTTLFFMWGFLTCMNDILVPHLRSIFDLSYAQVMLVQFAFFAAYFVLSIPAAKLTDRIGYQRSMVAGLLTMGAGALMFVPAASLPSYPLFLTALMALAAGVTVLQVSANPYLAVLGRPETASSRLNLAQAFHALGTALAPKIGGLMILSATPVTLLELRSMSPEALHYYRVAQAASVRIPYVLLGVMLIVLAAVIGSSRLPDIVSAERRSGSAVADRLWNHPNLIFGCLGIFVYVGAEVSIGSFLVNDLSQPQIGHLTQRSAAGLVWFYGLGAIAGRFVGSALLRRITTRALLAICALGAAGLVATSMLTIGHLAMGSLLGVGLFNSIMFPSIFTLGIAELGPLTSDGSGVMIMAMVGGAIIPAVQGLLADHIGIQHAFFLPVICYLYLLLFAVWGSRPNSERIPAEA